PVSDTTRPGLASTWRGCMRWPLWSVMVAEPSMEPALHPGDWLLLCRTIDPGRPLRVRAGQIVVARHPGRPGMLIVKGAARRGPGLRKPAGGGGGQPRLRRGAPVADRGAAAAALSPGTPTRPVIAGAGPAQRDRPRQGLRAD